MTPMIRILGHSPGLQLRVDTLTTVITCFHDDDELSPNEFGGYVEDLVSEWLVSVDKVFSSETCDIDDPIRESVAVFWSHPELSELLEYMTDEEYQPTAIAFIESDCYLLELEKRI